MSVSQIKYLKDYTEPNFWVATVDLIFTLNANKSVQVINTSKYIINTKISNNDNSDGDTTNTNNRRLILDGSAKLVSIALNGHELNDTQYKFSEQMLILEACSDEFELTITTELLPFANQTCMGLYASRNNLITQCEAQGFSKITYHQDRPDVLSRYTTTIIANSEDFPVLLANGNCVLEDNISPTIKKVIWVDPYNKPCYLFALVAGKFASLKDEFVTRSGKKVGLYIYSDANTLKYCRYAMDSLKRAMQFDEERFALEYDLDNYMIVATSDFNMGAMENKGLNIFNAKYLLGDPKTATDRDFILIEAVVGHEYFHNYTGNRVTCQNWFQLSLKEGLTVFREQEFTSTMHSRVVKRISDVRALRTLQFKEDNGPLAHPVMPASYVEINNFYTMTIYEKGAEIIRMYQTMFGEDGFNRGLSHYLSKHDGSFATCFDLCEAMGAVNNFDLTQFKLWYTQAGTPQVQVKDYYNQDTREYILEFTQIIPDTLGQSNKQPMLIPIEVGFLDELGYDIKKVRVKTGRYISHDAKMVLLLDATHNRFIFENVVQKPIPSLLRNFSAPIKLDYNYSYTAQKLIIMHDADEFNRYEFLQKLYIKQIIVIYNELISNESLSNELLINEGLINKGLGNDIVLDNDFFGIIRNILNDGSLSEEFRAVLLQLPNITELLPQMVGVDIVKLANAYDYLDMQIGDKLFDTWTEVYNDNLTSKYYFTDHGKRSLKNLALYYMLKALIFKVNNPNSLQFIETLVLGQFYNADNMTDTIAVLHAVNDLPVPMREELLSAFYHDWCDNELVMDKWFAIQAMSQLINTSKLNKLMVDKTFIATNPNKIYSLLNTFTNNIKKFNNQEGYAFIADKIAIIDQFNPQVASSLARGYSTVAYFSQKYKDNALVVLKQLLANHKLSNDVSELLVKIIEGLST